MEKNKQPTNGASIPVKGAMPKPLEKAAPPSAPAKDASAHKLDVKGGNNAHGTAHTTKK